MPKILVDWSRGGLKSRISRVYSPLHRARRYAPPRYLQGGSLREECLEAGIITHAAKERQVKQQLAMAAWP